MFEFGPGCSVRRLFAKEDPNIVLYWITIWDTLNLNVKLDLETELMKDDQRSSRVEGLPDAMNRKAMQISSYLRSTSQPNASVGTKRNS